jgi:hypothetical protein
MPLYANTTGSSNTAIGTQALAANTTASNNTAMGYEAFKVSTTAADSVAVGYRAGLGTTTGGSNTFLGRSAGESNTTGTFNTFVGIASGEAITTGSKNTIIGKYTGNQGGLDIRTSSNNIVLSDGDGNPRVHVDSNGNLFTTAGQLRATGDNGLGVFAAGQNITVADGATVNLSGGSSAQIICVGCGSTGRGAAFFANFNVTVSQIGGDAGGVSTTDSGTVDIAVYKDAGSNTVTFKNRSGGTKVYRISIFCGENGGVS